MDHEFTGAQEWQLPGYGREIPKREATTVGSPTQTPSQNVVQPQHQQKKPSTGPKAFAPPPRSVPNNRGAPNSRGRETTRGKATSPKVAPTQRNKTSRVSPAKPKGRNDTKPACVVQLPATFESFKHEFFDKARATFPLGKRVTGQGRTDVFEDISKQTGAYVKAPAPTDKVIEIWGEQRPVAVAEQRLRAIIAKSLDIDKPKAGKAGFAKIHAYSVEKEASTDNREKDEAVLKELRKPPAPGETFPEQLLFQWPKDGPSLTECLGPELESLDPLRAKHLCYLFIPKDMPGYICGLGNDHDAMKEITRRVRTLWAEAVTKSNRTKIYLVEPPAPKTMKSKIMVKIQNSQLHKPALRGNRLKGCGLEEWQCQVAPIQTKNNKRLLTAVENCLKGISFVRGHLRMRVNLGTFLLERYPKPEDGKNWYGFEEFKEIMLHEQTQGRLVPALKVAQPELLERCFEATHLLQPYDIALQRNRGSSLSETLRNAELAHSVNFEFLGADKSMLRLEVEFAKTPGAKEYAVKERRWLRPRIDGQSADKKPPLLVAVVDFGRSDWQLEIKSLEFHEASAIDASLKAFAQAVGFRTTKNAGNISAKPERHVTFPPDSPVSKFVEKTAIRYKIRDTDYVLEVARYDEYRRGGVPIPKTGLMMTGSISDVPYTIWGASIWSAEWDNLLGEHANLPVGHSAKYAPNIATFFPTEGNPSSPAAKDQTKGFWDFIDRVKQVAELLGPTRTQPEDTDADVSASKPAETPTAEPKYPAQNPDFILKEDLGTLF
ncbi:uncharacterized protein BDV14DRAFT_210937 [Aspergillus stella-maris]|uniref:uncharacterized protein n=1 Tax=Aspergillus stella-maris TaxID=1810926 RepID=UPI003CCE38D8